MGRGQSSLGVGIQLALLPGISLSTGPWGRRPQASQQTSWVMSQQHGSWRGRKGVFVHLASLFRDRTPRPHFCLLSLNLSNPEQTWWQGAASRLSLCTNPTHVPTFPSVPAPGCPTAERQYKALALCRHAGNGKGRLEHLPHPLAVRLLYHLLLEFTLETTDSISSSEPLVSPWPWSTPH